ncbi:MAG: mechanosensitive ion channel family protein [Planctomycetota bacterium]
MNWIAALTIAGVAAALFTLAHLAMRGLERQRHRLARPIRALRNLVLPLLAAVLMARYAFELASDNRTRRVLETLLWVALIHVALSLFNQTFFARHTADGHRRGIPKLFLDIVRGFLVLVGTCVVLASVWGVDLGSMFTALGVTSIVLGLALQNTLDNVMAGIALLFERPFETGDWIVVGGKVGQVVDVNWRSVRVRTRTNDILVIPNSVLGKEILVNYSTPTRVHGEDLLLGFSYDDPPNKVKRVLLKAALATRGVLADPAPRVRTKAFNAYTIDYQVRLFVDELERMLDILDEFMTQVWYAARRNGLTIPFPIQTSFEYHLGPPKPAVRPSARDALSRVPFLVPMSAEELEALANDATVVNFGRGERVVHQGDAGDSLFVIRDGSAIVTISDEQGAEREVARLGRGEFFGEMALLTGETRTANVTALDDIEVIVIHKDALHGILARRPGLAQEMAEIVEARRQGLRAIRDMKSVPPEKREAVRSGAAELVSRIRRFLGL